MTGHLLKSFLILAISSLSSLCWCQTDDPLISLFPIQNYDQKLTAWIKPTKINYDKSLLSIQKQKVYTEELYRHYFSSDADALSPWNPAYIKKILSMVSPIDVYSLENKIINSYNNKNQTEADQIGYGSNFRPYPDSWINSIKKNINAEQFRHLTYKSTHRVIAIDNLYARMLPTDEVHFYNHKLAGQGYPFDNLQGSVVWAGMPMYILGETLDHSWFLVVTPDYYIAWVKSIGVAYADNAFIKQWQAKAHHQMVAITHTHVPILDTENKIYRFSGYVGMIFPFDKKIKNKIQFLIPTADENKKAKIHHAILPKEEIAQIPLALTPRNFNGIINQLIERPYGWGGMYFYNDCSAELKSIYAVFGIWLPRHSTYQVDPEKVPGRSIDLSKPIDAAQRIISLEKEGHGFMTIVYVGDHVFMYLGTYPNPRDLSQRVALTYQNMWGLSPRPSSQRVVVGEAVLLPLITSYPEDSRLISHAGHKTFRIMNFDEMQEIEKFRVLEFNKIDMYALMGP